MATDTPINPVVGTETLAGRVIRVPGETNGIGIVKTPAKQVEKRGKILYPDPSYDAANHLANLKPNSAGLISLQQKLFEAGFYDSNDVIMYGRRSSSDVAALQKAMEEANVNAWKWEDQANFQIKMNAAGLTPSNASSGNKKVSLAGSINITGANSAKQTLDDLFKKYTGKPADAATFSDAYNKLVVAQTNAPIRYEKQKIKGKYYSVQVSDGVNADTFLEQYVFNKINFGSDKIGGVIGDSFSAIDNIADDYGVTLSVKERGQFVKGLTDGSLTANDVKKNLAAKANVLYKGMGGGINENISTTSLASDYINEMANLLEIDADKVKIKDVQKAFAGQEPMNLSDWAMEVKKDPRYNYTNRARSEAATFATNLASVFGFGQV